MYWVHTYRKKMVGLIILKMVLLTGWPTNVRNRYLNAAISLLKKVPVLPDAKFQQKEVTFCL